MFQSLVTVHNWADIFSKYIAEENGRLSNTTEQMLMQLKEILDIYNQACIVAVMDANGRIIEVNDSYCEISGYSQEELISSSHQILKIDFQFEKLYEEMWDTIRSGKVWAGELKNRRKDGSFYWVKTKIFPIHHKDGEPEKFISILADITEGKKYEEDLRTGIEDYAAIIKNLHNFVIRTYWCESRGPVISLLEGRLAEELGVSTKSVKWNRVVDVIGNPNQQPFIRHHFKKAYSGHPVKFEYKHGKRFFHATLSPVLDEQKRVKEVIASISDITELKRSELEVRNMASHDAITGLPNRRLLEEDLVYRLMEAKTEEKRAGIVLIDLDDFKNINDSLGHSVGDRFIMMAAERLQNLNIKEIVEDSKLYHIGGDEFIWFIFGFNELDLLKVVDLTLEVFEEPFIYKEVEFHQKASVGISVYPNSAGHAEELMKHADMALYEAKQSGRQTYRFFSTDMKGAFLSKIQMENDMRQAIKSENQFEMYYQPVIRTNDGKITSCEALIRWHHPEKGMVSPVDFIRVAEESGLIIPIGDFVVHQACKDLRHWDTLTNETLTISVNISTYQLQQTGFVRKLKNIVEQYEIKPGRIQLEITENGLMENTFDSINTLQKLRDAGFTIAIDDFGTGYSSLSYLKQFPVDCLKIDRSFVKELPEDRADRAIVSSTIKLGKDLGLLMVVEGVECKEAYEYLNSIGCPFVQGFYFSRPLPAEAFISQVIKGQ